VGRKRESPRDGTGIHAHTEAPISQQHYAALKRRSSTCNDTNQLFFSGTHLSEFSGEFMSATIGAPAPEFTLKDQNQQEVSLASFRGKKRVVLIFYPLDWSPVCTKEHACIVNDMQRFEKLEAQVLGLSVDSVWSHKAYAEKMGIQYPLLADFQPRGAVASKYGVFLEDKGITGRAISIIDRDGKLAWHKNYDIPVVPAVDEVAKALEEVK
jgi:mycoredoxin-dependent peroxiredoxin